MKKELMSIHGLIEEDLNRKLSDICLRYVDELKLSDRFFKIPLHISLKRSFYIADYENIRNDIVKMLSQYECFICNGFEMTKIKNRLWLKVEAERELYDVHEKLDSLLQERHGINIDEYDRNYHPHISLFVSDDEDKLNEIYEILNKELKSQSFVIDRFLITTDIHPSQTFCFRDYNKIKNK